jgi:hypothetical protein
MVGLVLRASSELSEFCWLSEPGGPDTAIKWSEDPIPWLSRSTLWRARAAREFLRYNLSQLPSEWRRRLCSDLENRWQTAFFELVVARTLQALDATLKIEGETDSGRRPDFLARFDSRKVIVEATTPDLWRDVPHPRRSPALTQIIEQNAPSGWSIAINDLPEIGPSDSLKEFTQTVKAMFRKVPPATESEESVAVENDTSRGSIALTLMPKRFARSAIVAQPGPAFYEGPIVAHLRRTLDRKRSQVRGSEHPVLLAMNGSFIAPLEAFDRALFGTIDISANRGNAAAIETRRNEGAFSLSRAGQPTFAGVIVYPNVGFTCEYEPVLYLHPRFQGELPRELEALARHEFTRDGGISKTPAKNPRVLSALHPVDLALEID